MHCDLVTWGYEYKLISTMAASCCLCLSVSPTSPKSIHTLSHLDETWCQGRGVFFNSVVAVSFCSVESGEMAPRGENAVLLRRIHNMIVILQLLSVICLRAWVRSYGWVSWARCRCVWQAHVYEWRCSSWCSRVSGMTCDCWVTGGLSHTLTS